MKIFTYCEFLGWGLLAAFQLAFYLYASASDVQGTDDVRDMDKYVCRKKNGSLRMIKVDGAVQKVHKFLSF